MTTPPNDGGPAFPIVCQGPTTGPEFYFGMSLRDWFAGMALQSLMSCNPPERNATTLLRQLGECSYLVADAMLAERSKQ